jgi:hypothetical protein
VVWIKFGFNFVVIINRPWYAQDIHHPSLCVFSSQLLGNAAPLQGQRRSRADTDHKRHGPLHDDSVVLSARPKRSTFDLTRMPMTVPHHRRGTLPMHSHRRPQLRRPTTTTTTTTKNDTAVIYATSSEAKTMATDPGPLKTMTTAPPVASCEDDGGTTSPGP